ncbi:MAG: hypothetical protein AAF821_08050 [Cyanobacteria bacterium P01_D01_bin.156]
MSFQPKEPATEAGKVARQQYLEIVRGVLGELTLDYPTIYEQFIQNDWAAIKLDDSVALAALKAGKSAKQVFTLLLQSPYVQHQAHEKQVTKAVMGRYVDSTVRQALTQLRGRQVISKTAQIQQIDSKMER